MSRRARSSSRNCSTTTSFWRLTRSDLIAGWYSRAGTALRLCYGGQRYSEDLYFTCGADASEPFDLGNMQALLRKQLVDRYRLDLAVGPPKAGRPRSFDDGGVAVKTVVFHSVRAGFAAKQRVHFEICNVPSYEAIPMLIQPR